METAHWIIVGGIALVAAIAAIVGSRRRKRANGESAALRARLEKVVEAVGEASLRDQRGEYPGWASRLLAEMRRDFEQRRVLIRNGFAASADTGTAVSQTVRDCIALLERRFVAEDSFLAVARENEQRIDAAVLEMEKALDELRSIVSRAGLAQVHAAVLAHIAYLKGYAQWIRTQGSLVRDTDRHLLHLLALGAKIQAMCGEFGSNGMEPRFLKRRAAIARLRQQHVVLAKEVLTRVGITLRLHGVRDVSDLRLFSDNGLLPVREYGRLGAVVSDLGKAVKNGHYADVQYERIIAAETALTAMLSSFQDALDADGATFAEYDAHLALSRGKLVWDEAALGGTRMVELAV